MSAASPNAGTPDLSQDINPFQLNSDDEQDQQQQHQHQPSTPRADPAPSASSPSSRHTRTPSSPPSYSHDDAAHQPWGQQQASHDHLRQSSSSHSQSPANAANAANANPPSYQPTPAPNIDMSNVTIVDAQKTTDHVGASNFIVYVIRSGTDEAKRRYSEFEALRSALVQLHPTLIIPPIPSKHTLSDYAVKQSKAKEDATIIARRKRMLQSFLRRCASHPELQHSDVLRKFLDGRWTWHEISTSPPITNLPKSNLKAPPTNPADPNASPAYSSLPVPASSTTQLRNPNQRYLDSEAFTNRFATHMSGSLEKTNRRVARRWGDAAGDFAELGAVLNGFSLSEQGQLATAIEKTGQASDSTFMSIGGLLQDWEQSLTEPLHEYVQFASVLQKLLKWRHLKQLQLELAQDALDAKKLKLDELERVEAEAKRLERALETGGRSLTGGGQHRGGSGPAGAWDSSSRAKSSIYGGAVEDNDTRTNAAGSTAADGIGGSSEWSNGVGQQSGNSSTSRPTSPTSPTASARRGGSSHNHSLSSSGSSSSTGYGLFSALSQTFSSVLDVDPESTRRREISRLREEVLLLDEAVSLSTKDLQVATERIQADLDRFQRLKIRDFKEMMLRSAKMHREFCRINLQNWSEAQEEIGKVQRKVVGSGATDWPSTVMPESSLVRKEEEDGVDDAQRW